MAAESPNVDLHSTIVDKRPTTWFLSPSSGFVETDDKTVELSFTHRSLTASLRHPDILSLLRAYFVLCSLAIITIRLIPPLRDRFLSYGARRTRPDPSSTHDEALKRPPARPNIVIRALDYLTTLTVPHAYFIYFYSTSMFCTSFWLTAIFIRSNLLVLANDRLPLLVRFSTAPQTSPARIGLSLLLYHGQAFRRHRESSAFNSRPSTSRMSLFHYILGITFYIATNTALIVEHTRTLLALPSPLSLFLAVNSSPTPLQTLALLAVLLASYSQHTSHVYLSRLPKYTLPAAFPFTHVIAPHYTAECVIYLSLSVIAAPAGYVFNGTLLCAFLFVAVNLGVTAGGTRTWMLAKFREEEVVVRRRWRMVPGLW